MVDGLLEAYNHAVRVARKNHRCCECQGWIVKGENYHYHSGIWEGSGVSYKHCNDCEAIFKEVDRDIRDPYDVTAFEGLAEAVEYDEALKERFREVRTRRRAFPSSVNVNSIPSSEFNRVGNSI